MGTAHGDGAFNKTFMTGAEYTKWVDGEEKRHRDLMKEAGFLAELTRSQTNLAGAMPASRNCFPAGRARVHVEFP